MNFLSDGSRKSTARYFPDNSHWRGHLSAAGRGWLDLPSGGAECSPPNLPDTPVQPGRPTCQLKETDGQLQNSNDQTSIVKL